MSTTQMSIEEGKQRAKDVGATPGPGKAPLNGDELLQRPGRLVDLTRPLYEGMPMWFGHQKTYFSVNQTIEGFKKLWSTDNGFYARHMTISEHAGTHADATIEYDPDGFPLDKMPLEFYYGTAVCIDLSEARFQDGTTAERRFKVAEIVSWISQRCTLKPGDLIATGTGGGLAQFTGRYMQPGDTVRVEIDGIGRLEDRIVPEP